MNFISKTCLTLASFLSFFSFAQADHKCCGCDQILFKANLSFCNIAEGNLTMVQTLEEFVENDTFALPSSIATGADFVTAFGGNDFSCAPVPCGCGIEVRPANGSSFTLSVPAVPNPGPVIGGLFDHVKFLAYSLYRIAPTNGCTLCTTWVGSGSQLQVDTNPFGAAIQDPHSDPRLACTSFASIDPATLTTFDWIITDKVIYALVERLPVLNSTYAAYTYVVPVFHRKHKTNPLDDVHTFKTCYNRLKGTVTWVLDGKKVMQITKIGHRLTSDNTFVYHHGRKKALDNPTRFQVQDHGGTDEDVSPEGLQTGLALFTLLDWYQPQTSQKITETQIINSGFYNGLVRLESNLYRFGTTYWYGNPLQGGQETFVQDSALSGLLYQSTIPSTYRIFGQGAALRLYDYKVSLESKI